MDILLLALLVSAAALACPAMMWWQRRQGRNPACCMPRGRQARVGPAVRSPEDLEELRLRHARLTLRIAELEATGERGTTRSPR